MFKKMGRPTRKEVATTVIYEEPNGNIIYFVIDHKGNSKLFGNQSLTLPQINVNMNTNPFPNSSGNKTVENKEKTLSNENNTIKNKKVSPKAYIEMDKFDDFIMSLDSQINMDSLLKNHKPSENLFPAFN